MLELVIEKDNLTPEGWNREAIGSLGDLVGRIKTGSRVTLLRRFYGIKGDSLQITIEHPPGGWEPLPEDE